MQLLETQLPTLPTIPVRAAQIFASDLLAKGGDFNEEVAHRIESQIAVAQLSGMLRIDFGQAMRETYDAHHEATAVTELDTSIDSLIGQVIDLR